MALNLCINAKLLRVNVDLKSCRLTDHPQNHCRLSFTDEVYPEKIYGTTYNHVANLPKIYDNDRQSETYSILRDRKRIHACKKHAINVSVVFMKLNNILISESLLKLCNTLTNYKPGNGPSEWRACVYHNHLNFAMTVLDSNNHSYSMGWLKECINQLIPSLYYFNLMYYHLFWTTWYPALLKMQLLIYKAGTGALSFDVSFPIGNVYESENNVNKLLDKGDFDHELYNKHYFKHNCFKTVYHCDLGILSINNDLGLIVDLVPTPKRSEAHKDVIPALLHSTMQFLKHSLVRMHGMQYKSDGLLHNIRLPAEIGDSILSEYGNSSFDYDLIDFVKNIDVGGV